MAAPVLQLSRNTPARPRPAAGPVRGVHPPRDAECAPVWDTPIPSDTPAAVWLLGAHGGAGVSTLCQWIGRAGDAQGRWPGGHGNQSPFVIVVAEESVAGMTRAHQLLRQYATGAAGNQSHLLGVATVARVPGKRPQAVRQRRELLKGLTDVLWEIPFIPGLNEHDVSALPVWALGDPPTQKKRHSPREAVPAKVAEFGGDVMATISSHLAARGQG